MSPDSLATLKRLNITLPDGAAARFDMLSALLLSENEKVNLTAITDPAEVETKHFIDSLTALPLIPTEARTLADIGSGAGFPALPIAIARPDLAVTAIESVGKKASFIERAAEALGLTNVSVAGARAEDVGAHGDYRDRFDVAVSRAVAPLPALVEYALPLLKEGGVFIAMKSADEPSDAATRALQLLNGRIEETRPVELPGASPRVLLVIKKTGPTPDCYPRRAGVPLKKPL